MKNIQRLLATLVESKIDFVIVGGFAAVIHGSSQTTQDLDICVALDHLKIETLRKVLKPFHAYHRMTPQKLSFAEFPTDVSNVNNLYLQTDIGPLDILTQIIGIEGGFQRLCSGAVTIHAFGLDLRVISLEDLLIAKKTLARPKDLIVAQELELLLANKK